MKLNSIEIINFKSIKDEMIRIEPINGSSTFCLFGVNESGKSSLLKGMALFDEESIDYPADFYDESKMVEVVFSYTVENSEVLEFKEILKKKKAIPKEIIDKIQFENLFFDICYKPENNSKKERITSIDFITNKFPKFKLVGNLIEQRDKDDTEESFNLNDYIIKSYPDHFWGKSHQTIYWEASDNYLLLEDIDLVLFVNNPEKISIPLLNSFKLAGIKESELLKTVKKIDKPASKRNLESKLSDSVTSHIKSVWKNHEIEIKFSIDKGKISLLIEDIGVKHKAKTTKQRSDGFRQFISFLLTMSAQNAKDDLNNSLLLIDEPETHLHPQAQVDILRELINISSKNGNVVFFATHSNYLIDKVNLERNFSVQKIDNDNTRIKQLKNSTSTYSEVNYQIFGIATTDYHNELFGFLEENKKSKIDNLKKTKEWKMKIKDDKIETIKVSFPKYIRNTIHHPENRLNKSFTEKQLKTSIDLLRKIKYD